MKYCLLTGFICTVLVASFFVLIITSKPTRTRYFTSSYTSNHLNKQTGHNSNSHNNHNDNIDTTDSENGQNNSSSTQSIDNSEGNPDGTNPSENNNGQNIGKL